MRFAKILTVLSLAALSACDSNDGAALVYVASDSCGINAPASAEFDRKVPLEPWGWAFDKATGTIPGKIFVQLSSEDNKVGLSTAMTRTSRADVGQAFGRPELNMAGFSGKIDISTLPAGVYTVSVVQHEGARTLVCPGPAKITLK